METAQKTLPLITIANTWSLIRRAISFGLTSIARSLAWHFAPSSEVTGAKADNVHNDYLLAGNARTSGKQLEVLAGSKSPRVRGRVGENPSCPTSVLKNLSGDADPDVRISVTQNPRLSHNLLKKLSGDDCLDVPFAMAENPNLPSSILQTLIKHTNPYISECAKKTLERRQNALSIDSHSTKISGNVYWCLLPPYQTQMSA